MQKKINELLNLYKTNDFQKLEILSSNLLREFPDQPFILKALSIALKKNGKLKKSLEVSKKVVNLNPNDPEALYNHGNILKMLNKIDDAELSFRSAIKINPKYVQAYNNLALVTFEKGRLQETKNIYEKLISLNSNYAEAYNNLGIVLKELGNFKEAEINFNKAISLNSNYAEAYNNLGIVLRELEKIHQSKNNYEIAIKLKPNFYEAYFNLGLTFRELGELEKSIDCYQKALNLKFNYPEAHNSLGVALAELGKLNDAKISYKNAIKLKPNYAEAYTNLSFVYFVEKNFKRAFDLFDWNWKIKKNFNQFFKTNKPIWNNEKNSKVLIWREQGIGDEIMFSSVLKEMCDYSKKLIVYCDDRLIPIFKRSFSNKIIFESNIKKLIDYDYHIPMSSLFKFFRKELPHFINSSNLYLYNDIEKTNEIKEKLKIKKGIKIVGINWKTFSKNTISNFRNITLEKLTTHLNNSNIRFINLQYGDVKEEIFDLKKKRNIDVIDVNNIDKTNDIDSLASLISACDIIVSIDNFLVHLAGALGVNTKLILPKIIHSPRWGLTDKNSYLHDSVSIYRQHKNNDWSEPLSKIKELLI